MANKVNPAERISYVRRKDASMIRRRVFYGLLWGRVLAYLCLYYSESESGECSAHGTARVTTAVLDF